MPCCICCNLWKVCYDAIFFLLQFNDTGITYYYYPIYFIHHHTHLSLQPLLFPIPVQPILLTPKPACPSCISLPKHFRSSEAIFLSRYSRVLQVSLLTQIFSGCDIFLCHPLFPYILISFVVMEIYVTGQRTIREKAKMIICHLRWNIFSIITITIKSHIN